MGTSGLEERARGGGRERATREGEAGSEEMGGHGQTKGMEGEWWGRLRGGGLRVAVLALAACMHLLALCLPAVCAGLRPL